MKKKILSIILAIVMIVVISSVGAIAVEGSKGAEVEPNYFYVENATSTAGSVTWSIQGSLTSPKLQYSTDGEKWTDVTIGTAIDIPANGKVYFCGDNPDGLSTETSNYISVSCDVSHKVGGDITTLMNKSGNVEVITSACTFIKLFYDDVKLTDAGALLLPSAKISELCYAYMFSGCTSLTAAPALPATELAEWCYSSMFNKCESLETAPALPATELAKDCYSSMFYKCTSLKTAPALPATELAEGCYSNMFNKCESLETAPVLPAAELVADCYFDMFFSCKNLNSVTVGFTEFGENSETYGWLTLVADRGTFYAPVNFVEPSTKSENTVPHGWTIETAMSPVYKHTYGDATYIWNEDLTTCTAYHTCTYAACGHTELETVDTVKGDTEITATFTKAGFTAQSKMLADVTPQFYVSCYAEDGQCLTVGVPEVGALNLEVSQDVYENMKTAKLFTVNSSFVPLRPERTITK